MPRTIELFPFRFRDQPTGKWIRARYLAERHEIEERYREWEIPASLKSGSGMDGTESCPPAYHKADGVRSIRSEARQYMHRLNCKCGSVSGYVRDGTPSNHLRCYCSDCQAFGRFFGPDSAVLDRKGGTEIVQVSQSRVQIERGLDQLACMRLSPKGLLRWYARCCNTPIGNTLANPRVSVIGLIHTCLDAATLERNFGSSTADVNTNAAIGPGKPTQHGLLSTVSKVLVMILTDRITGRYRKSQFFSEAGKPVVEPRILSSDEVALLKRTT
jgi:hypothetical protein